MSGDNLISGICDLADIGWAAQHRSALRVQGMWIVEGNVCAFVKKVMTGPLKQIQEAFLEVDFDKYSHRPSFNAKVFTDVKAAFGKSPVEILNSGQLMPHDRACNIGKFTAKTMAFKFSNEKSPTCQIGTGFDIPEIGEGYKCTWIKFFQGKSVELYVVKGIEKHIQALADPLRTMVDNLKQVLVLCSKRDKKGAEKLLAEVQKAWSAAFKEEAARDRHHIIYDALMGQYPAEEDEDGFEPLVASSQPLNIVPAGTAVSILEGVYDVSQSEAAETAKATHAWDGTAGGAKVAAPTHRSVTVDEANPTSGRRSSVIQKNEDDTFVHHYGADRVAEKIAGTYEATSASHKGKDDTTERPAGPHDPNVKITHFDRHAGGRDHGDDVEKALVNKSEPTELERRLAAMRTKSAGGAAGGAAEDDVDEQ